jgi:hypothetical protein
MKRKAWWDVRGALVENPEHPSVWQSKGVLQDEAWSELQPVKDENIENTHMPVFDEVLKTQAG